MEALIGRYFGQYRLKKIVGRGGMGTVFMAYEEELDRTVALKVLHPGLAKDKQFVERFVREARLLASLSHPNLIHVYSIGRTEDDYHYFAMEYLSGNTLDKYIKSHHPIPLDRGWHYCGQVLSALNAIHKSGLVHRDVKPSNIMLATDDRAVLMDFGLAKNLDAPALTQDGIIAGTPEYMSPEQARGDSLDGRSDLYALGVMVYEMFTSVVPFSGKSAIQILRKHCEAELPELSDKRADLPAQVAFIVRMAMAKEVSDRFQDAPEMADAMQKVLPTSELLELSRGVKHSDLKKTLIVNGTAKAGRKTPLPSRGESSMQTRDLVKRKKALMVLSVLIIVLLTTAILAMAFWNKSSFESRFATPRTIKNELGTELIANPICEFFLGKGKSVFGTLEAIDEDNTVYYIPEDKSEPEPLPGVERIRILSQEERKNLEQKP